MNDEANKTAPSPKGPAVGGRRLIEETVTTTRKIYEEPCTVPEAGTTPAEASGEQLEAPAEVEPETSEEDARDCDCPPPRKRRK